MKNWNCRYSVHLEEQKTNTWQSWKMKMYIICTNHWTYIKHWYRKMGSMGTPLIIDDGVYLCICTVYSSVFKKVTQHTFVYDSNYQHDRWVNAVVHSLIMYHMHPSFYWRKKIEKQRFTKEYAYEILWWELHSGVCIQSYWKWFFITYKWIFIEC